MTNYVKSTSFASKDALATGNPLKIVKGTEIDTEFNNIAVSSATKADLLSPVFTGAPTAPTAATTTATTQLATTAFVVNYITSVFPTGSIIMWSGALSAIPSGWLLCDGDNDTPDLRGKFVIGAGVMDAVFTAIAGASVTAAVSGTELTVSAVSTGVVAVNQKVTGVGIPDDMVITTLGTGLGNVGTYVVSYEGSAASVTGSIAGTTLTVTSVASGKLIIGQILSGTGIASDTKITALKTGTGGTGTYTVSISQTLSSRSLSAVGTFTSLAMLLKSTSLSVTALTSGSLSVSQYVIGTGIPFSAKIIALETGTGGIGTYTLDTFIQIASTENLSASAGTVVAGTVGGSKDTVVVSHSHTGTTASGGAATGSTSGGNGTGDFGTYNAATGVFSLSGGAPNRPQGSAGGGSQTTANLSIPAHTHTLTTDSEGVSGTNANLPPYFALAYIMKT
jgi:hypothetical protein